jgi:hypothetical protein
MVIPKNMVIVGFKPSQYWVQLASNPMEIRSYIVGLVTFFCIFKGCEIMVPHAQVSIMDIYFDHNSGRVGTSLPIILDGKSKKIPRFDSTNQQCIKINDLSYMTNMGDPSTWVENLRHSLCQHGLKLGYHPQKKAAVAPANTTAHFILGQLGEGTMTSSPCSSKECNTLVTLEMRCEQRQKTTTSTTTTWRRRENDEQEE